MNETPTVPAALAWLQLGGGVVVPRSSPVEPLAEQRLHRAELAAEAARHRVAETKAAALELAKQVEQLERDLEQARLEPHRLNLLLTQRERELRAARQHAHSERALRLELEEARGTNPFARSPADETSGEPAARLRLRVRELEEEVATLRRALAEAEHLAESAAGTRPQATIERLRRELDARVVLEATLAELRNGLDHLRADAEREHENRARAEAEAAAMRRRLEDQADQQGRAWELIEQLRSQAMPVPTRNGTAGSETSGNGTFREREAPAVEAPEHPTAAIVEPERFAQALTRLRAATPASPAATAAPVADDPAIAPQPLERRWLERALRDVARSDRPTAARLLSELAPTAETERDRLTALMGAGRLRRTLARLRGRRWPPAELRTALRHPASLAELGLEPRLALALAAVMIDRGRSGSESFTMAYQRPGALDPALYLQVWERDPTVLRDTAPSGRIATTIVCPPEALPGVLEGDSSAAAHVSGEEWPLELVRSWLERAQSG